VAVLGEMRELGERSTEAHAELGRLAARAGVRLLVVGGGARAIHDAASAERRDSSTWVADTDAATALLAGTVGPGDVVLVKASRAAGLERVAHALAGPAGNPA
jgi:UDP-N-acetylmuramoyl-tripeptide--D-alanyl-D-alanine ligase